MTLKDQFQKRLAHYCRGREGHADAINVSALVCLDGLTRIWWEDLETGERRRLGPPLSDRQAPEIIRAVLAQLRHWRAGVRHARTRQRLAAAGGDAAITKAVPKLQPNDAAFAKGAGE